MKTSHILQMMIGGLLIAAPITASAQTPGSVQTLTLNLIFSYTGPGTMERDEDGKIIKKDEFGDPAGGPAFENMWTITKEKNDEIVSQETHDEFASKMVSKKYGNKEFLMDLVDIGFITPTEGNNPIANWTIILVTPSVPGPDGLPETGEPTFFAFHTKTLEAVDLTGILVTNEPFGAFADTEKFKRVVKDDFVKETTTETVSYSGLFKGVTTIEIVDPITLEPVAQGQGIFTGSEKIQILGKGEDAQFVSVQGAAKIANISGIGPIFDELFQFDPSVMEGSVSAGAGKLFPDIDPFFAPIP